MNRLLSAISPGSAPGAMPALPAAVSPAGPEVLSVSAFTQQIKLLLEGEIPPSWVSGEVSNLKVQESGHVYFSLKDKESQLSCVLFKGDALRLPFRIREGMGLVVYGQLSLYAPRGSYQLVAKLALEKGLGPLQAEFERLKTKLQTEGLFDPARKRSIPLLPKRVGIITSPTGAAIRDFLSILARLRFPGEVVLLPALVQGEGAVASLVAQVERAQSLALDLLVIGRGGGSIEDLWAFNGEALVRALAHSAVPTISAVGHQIDFTLCDFVADRRAETPSAAAEMIARGALELRERFLRAQDRFHQTFQTHWRTLQHRLERAQLQFLRYGPQRQIEHFKMRLDDLQNRLQHSLGARLQLSLGRLEALAQALEQLHPRATLARHRVQLQYLSRCLTTAIEHRLATAQVELQSLAQRLEAHRLENTLQRGFMLMRTLNGRILTRRSQVPVGELLIGEFADGQLGFYTLGPGKAAGEAKGPSPAESSGEA